MQGMNKPRLSPEEQRAQQVLDLTMRVLDITDQELAERVGVKRQTIQQRRHGYTRIRYGDVTRLAEGLGVSPLLFSCEPQEVLRFLADTYSEQVKLSLRWISECPGQMTLVA